MVQAELKEFLEEFGYLDPFQSDFRSGYGIGTALVTFVADLLREISKGTMSLLIVLHLWVNLIWV